MTERTKNAKPDTQKTGVIQRKENLEVIPFRPREPAKPIPIYDQRIYKAVFYNPPTQLYSTELKSVLRLCDIANRQKNEFIRDMIDLAYMRPEAVLNSETLANISRIKHREKPVYKLKRELNPMDSIVNVCYSSNEKTGNPYWLDIPFILLSRISDKLSAEEGYDENTPAQPTFLTRKRLKESEDDDIEKKLRVIEKATKILSSYP